MNCQICGADGKLFEFKHDKKSRNLCVDCYKAASTGIDVYEGKVDKDFVKPKLSPIEEQFTDALSKFLRWKHK